MSLFSSDVWHYSQMINKSGEFMFESIIANSVNLTSASLYLEQEDDTEVGCCCFIAEDNLVVMNITEVLEIAELTEVSKEEAFKTVLLHEIGHSLDKELTSLIAKSGGDWDGDITEEKFISEVNAWRIADSLVEQVTKNYKLLRAWCLDSYAIDPEWIAKYCPDYF
jgi:hypothetical protein